MRQVFLDTETTGMNPGEGDRIVELGCVEVVNRQPTGRTLHLYFNPGRPSHPDALRVHGISEEFLADKPRFEEVAKQVVEFLQGAQLVIHNAAFDILFLESEFARCALPPLTQSVDSVHDSLLLARSMFPGKSNSLDALCRRMEVDNKDRTFHGALLDARLLCDVYLRMTRGQENMLDALMDSDSAPTANDRSAAAMAGDRSNRGRLIGNVADASDGSLWDGADLNAAMAHLEFVVDEDDLLKHNEYLKDLEKSTKGRSVWKPIIESDAQTSQTTVAGTPSSRLSALTP